MIRLRIGRWMIVAGLMMGQLFQGAPPVAAKVIINEKVVVLGTVYDECNEEMIEFSGILHIKLQEFVGEDGATESISTTKLQGEGVGVTSGASYQIKEKEQSVIILHPIVCLSSTTIETTTTLISQGGAENMVLRTLVTLGFDENCSPAFGVASEVECRL